MREIIFRGKRIDNGEWVVGFLVPITVNCYDKGYEIIEKDGIEYDELDYYHPSFCSDRVIPETVGQYTGLTDKNGTKIFEGDIFLIDDEYHAVVIFEDGCFRLQVHGLCGTYTEGGYCEDGGGYGIIECDPIDWFFVHDMKIIGNIHDNPELLKGGADNG